MGDIGGPQTTKKADGMNEEIAFTNSSFLASASYNPSAFQLTVNFKTGSQIVYQQVYPATWEGWKLHPSKGSYYANFIKGKAPGLEVQKPLKVSDIKKAKERNPWQRKPKIALSRKS